MWNVAAEKLAHPSRYSACYGTHADIATGYGRIDASGRSSCCGVQAYRRRKSLRARIDHTCFRYLDQSKGNSPLAGGKESCR